jgi:hypothetical protein
MAMTPEIRLVETEEGVAVPLPEEVVSRFGLAAGDRLRAVEMAEGLLLIPHDADFNKAMRAFDEVRQRYRETLRKLAD